MFIYWRKIIILIIIFYSENLSATLEHYAEDLELSRTKCLISGVPLEKLEENKKGVMTLCFKEQDGWFSFDHSSLVFEIFLPKTPTAISLKMIHFGQEDACFGLGGKMKYMIDTEVDTLKKVYRAQNISAVTANTSQESATYIRYASWVILNENLLKGYKEAEEYERISSIQLLSNTDKTLEYNKLDKNQKISRNKKLKESYNCVQYVSKIMRTVGLTVDFGYRFNTPKNLRLLVDNNQIIPNPDYKKNDLPIYKFN